MADGDDTYPAETAREMVNLVIEKKVDMVVGDRLSSTYFTENKRPFAGLTLQTMVQKNRQDFEMQLITCSDKIKERQV